MTNKILNGKRLKADKKERQTTDNSSVRHFIWLTRLYATGYAWAANDDTPVPHLSDKDFRHKMQEERR